MKTVLTAIPPSQRRAERAKKAIEDEECPECRHKRGFHYGLVGGSYRGAGRVCEVTVRNRRGRDVRCACHHYVAVSA